MLQLFARGQQIDLLNDISVSVVMRSKMFQGSQGSRTWTLRCGRTSNNVEIFEGMKSARQYTLPAEVYYVGQPLVRGEMRLMGWDDAAYSVVVVASASTAHIDDQRKVVDVLRAYVEAHGGWGQWTPPSGHIGTHLEGDQQGRWAVADWWDCSARSMAQVLAMLSDVDNDSLWPSAWAAEQPKMQQYLLYPTDSMQFGGWTGEVAGGYNRMPYDVVQGNGTLKNRWTGAGGDGMGFIEFRGVSEYGDTGCYWMADRAEYMAGIFRYGSNTFMAYVVADAASTDATPEWVTLAKFGDPLNVRPYVVAIHSAGAFGDYEMVRVDEMLALFGWQSGVGTIHLTNAAECSAVCRGTPTSVYTSEVVKIGHTVQEQPIAMRRGSPNGLPTEATMLGDLYYSTAKTYPAVEYPILGAFAEVTCGDLARFCLWVLGLDIDAQGTSEQYLAQNTMIEVTSLVATIETRSDGDTQQTSAKPQVLGANGFTFTRGGNSAVSVPFSGLSLVAPLGWVSSVPIAGYATTAEAPNAEEYKGAGVFVFFRLYDASGYYWPQPPTAPYAFARRIGQGAPSPATPAPTLPARAVKYVARGRCSAVEAVAMAGRGSITIQGRGVSGAVEQVTWSSSGDVEVVFWG